MSTFSFAEARSCFEALPGPDKLKLAVSKLLAAGHAQRDVRTWAVAISREFGIWNYVGAHFEAHIMQPALRMAQQENVA